MDDFLKEYDNFRWLISCAADRIAPETVKDGGVLQDRWRWMVFNLVCEMQAGGILKIRWDCIRSAALSRLSKQLLTEQKQIAP